MNHRDKSALIIVGIVLLILVTAFAFIFTSKFQNTTRVIVGDAVISAEVVASDTQRSKGLSGKEKLQDGEGMLFIFDKDGRHGIWMKDMKIDIDIIWLNKDKKVVHIVKNAQPKSYPKVFKPDKPARYVLEVPAGFAAKKNIVVGASADFSSNALQ